jgi:hypothetical protein
MQPMYSDSLTVQHRTRAHHFEHAEYPRREGMVRGE